MTREAIRRVKGYLTDYLPADDYEEVEEIIKALEQELSTQERQAESDKFDAAFQDGYNNGYAQTRFDYEEEIYNKGYEDGAKSVNICPYCGEYIGEEDENND